MTFPSGQPRWARSCPHDQGFSLIETLIALVIIAAMTAALVGTTTQDARTRLAVHQRREALMVAQSALDQVADVNAADAGQWRGYTWSVAREPYAQTDPLDRHPLEQVSVAVKSKGREVLRLSTVRIKP
ncbi:type II secretion system protein [Novosphingobium sp. Chol11]|uniref:type II secretion system protein n=1 Tax=Novosphingobium sp. Chol11 TaxID=1385763 RepID=UPI0025F4629F|nr:type II secretion system protein [Novosphingobium sp. Chol11]